ncbi:hypothetical protein CVT24_004608 [Panaeolus cyanescens]|uniref:DUF6699 domain-containing protein n=1 Tax=Panaeolus cyanescens TaxID=181874 RepID=A0A409YBD7_9AGAR|nr:hypothetical protein CVT24_004608 [Panaeolus cyanescens]
MTDLHAQHLAVPNLDQPEETTSSSSSSQRAYSQPMPVIIRPIQLPPLYSSPVVLHPFLQFSPFTTCILYDLSQPPSTAAILSSINTLPALRQCGRWMAEPATFPSNICSITIRIVGLDRPIVIVSPTGSSTGEITIWDVLSACHRAWRQASDELYTRHYNALPYNSSDFWSIPHPCPVHPPDNCVRRQTKITSTVNQMKAGRLSNGLSHLGHHASLWTGLTSSQEEPDVWVLNPACHIGRKQTLGNQSPVAVTLTACQL